MSETMDESNNDSKNNSCSKPSETLTPLLRYDYLIKARNFHYDNYNKWMTYFYVAIAALFVGYCTLETSTNNNKTDSESLIILLGYVVSLLWYWSSKGYYYWNINFITLVNECEKKDLDLTSDRRVYFVFANMETQNNYFSPISGANISTSKIAILFAFIISIVWGVLGIEKLEYHIEIVCQIILSVILTISISYIVPKSFLFSKIDHFPDLKIKHKSHQK